MQHFKRRLRTSWSDCIENLVALISLLNIFVVFNFLDQARVKFYGLFKKYFCIWSPDTKKVHFYAYKFSVSCFSSSGTHQTQYFDGCQAVGINSFFNFCLLSLPFFIAIVPLKKYIVIIIIIIIPMTTNIIKIVIMPHI